MLARLIESRAVRDPGWNLWGTGADVKRDGNTAAGMSVTGDSALNLLSVYGSTAFIADAVSLLPVGNYRKTDGRLTEIPRPSWMDEAHPDLGFPEFVNQQVGSLLLAGNGYCIPVRNGVGQVLEVWPIHPNDVTVRRSRPGARPTYDVYGQTLTAGQVVHVRAFTMPGDLVGLNPVAYARQTIGAGLALEEFAGRFFGDGVNPSGIIEAPGEMGAEQTGMLREQFEAFHRGIRKSHGVAVLSGGASYRPITIAPEDAQFLETRNFTAASIAAGMFRLPPDFVGATLPGGSSLTYQNITDRWVELTRRAFMPWISRLEWMFTYRLLPRPQVAKFDVDEYTRASMGARFEAWKIGIEAGFLEVNDVRVAEDLPPLAVQPAVPPAAAAAMEGQ